MQKMQDIIAALEKRAEEVSDIKTYGSTPRRAYAAMVQKVSESGRPLAFKAESFTAAQSVLEQIQKHADTSPDIVVKQYADTVVIAPLALVVGEALGDAPSEIQAAILGWADGLTEGGYRKGFLDGTVRNQTPGDYQQIRSAVESPLADLERAGAKNGQIRLRDTLQARKRNRESAEKALSGGDLGTALQTVGAF